MPEVEAMRARMVEQIAETDDDLTIKYLEGEEISVDELKAALRRAVIAGKATPVFCGSSLRNKGVQPVLDAVIDYLPSPADIPPVVGTHPQDRRRDRAPRTDDAPLSALVFKIVTDPYVGRLAYFRVYSGKLAQGAMVYNSTKDRRERIGRLVAHVRRPARRYHRGAGGRYRRGAGPERNLHRRYAVRSQQPDLAGEHHLPRAGHLGGD